MQMPVCPTITCTKAGTFCPKPSALLASELQNRCCVAGRAYVLLDIASSTVIESASGTGTPDDRQPSIRTSLTRLRAVWVTVCSCLPRQSTPNDFLKSSRISACNQPCHSRTSETLGRCPKPRCGVFCSNGHRLAVHGHKLLKHVSAARGCPCHYHLYH